LVAGRTHRSRRARTGARPRVARECHPAVATSPKAVQRSRDRGCKDHRILRRASFRWKTLRIITELSGHAERSRVVSALRLILRPVHRGPKPRTRPACSSCEGGRGARQRQGATGVSEARSRQRRGKKTPTLVPSGNESRARRRSAEAVLDVVKHPVPRSCRTEPKTPWGVPAAKAARASREHTRCGCTQFVWVADIGRTHRASFTPGGRKACWWSKGASQEEVRSSA